MERSMSQIRTLIKQGAARINGEKITEINYKFPMITCGTEYLIEIGKREKYRVLHNFTKLETCSRCMFFRKNFYKTPYYFKVEFEDGICSVLVPYIKR